MTATPDPAPATASWSVDEGSRAVSAVAVGLLSAAVVISALYSRESGDLDWSNFTMGVLASVGLLGFAALSPVRRPGTQRSSVVGWPAAAGSVGVAAMVAVLMDDGTATIYVTGALLVGLGVIAYLLTRDSAAVLVVLAGTTITYVQAYSDVFGETLDLGEEPGGGNLFKIGSAAVLAYVIAVTAIGWFLPKSRVLTAVVSGAIGIAAYGFILQLIFFSRTFAAFAGFPSEYSMDGEMYGPDSFPSSGSMQEAFEDNPYADDVMVLLIFAGVLLVFWCFCAVVTGHVAFRVLSVAISVLLVPAATAVLTVQHPTWWSVAVAAIGGLLLLLLLLRRPGNGTS